MNKATKIDEMTFLYRGFRITRNFISKHGSGRVCDSQQGFAVTPSVSYGSSSGINGKWEPSLASAAAHVDDLYRRYDSLPDRVKAVVEEAARAELADARPTPRRVRCPPGPWGTTTEDGAMAKIGDAKRLMELKDELREPKARLMRTLSHLEVYDRSLAKRLGTIIGKIEDLQRRMPG